MAATARTFTRLTARSTPLASSLKTPAARNTCLNLPRQPFQRSSRRGYASAPPTKSRTGLYATLVGLATAGGAGTYFYLNNGGITELKKGSSGESRGVFTPTKDDYQKVYNEIAKLLEEKDDYDDGSYGPVIVRLAWHCSGTYDKETNTGGSNGATMRFAPEGDHGANAGLKAARDFLEPVKGTPTYSPSTSQRLHGVSPLILSDRKAPLDHILRSLDPRRRGSHPRDARSHHPLASRPHRPRRINVHA